MLVSALWSLGFLFMGISQMPSLLAKCFERLIVVLGSSGNLSTFFVVAVSGAMWIKFSFHPRNAAPTQAGGI